MTDKTGVARITRLACMFKGNLLIDTWLWKFGIIFTFTITFLNFIEILSSMPWQKPGCNWSIKLNFALLINLFLATVLLNVQPMLSLCPSLTCQPRIIWQSWIVNLSFYPFLCPSLTCRPRIIWQYWVINLSFGHPWGWVYQISGPFTNLWLTKISSRDFVKMRIWSYILWELGSQIPTFSPTK